MHYCIRPNILLRSSPRRQRAANEACWSPQRKCVHFWASHSLSFKEPQFLYLTVLLYHQHPFSFSISTSTGLRPRLLALQGDLMLHYKRWTAVLFYRCFPIIALIRFHCNFQRWHINLSIVPSCIYILHGVLRSLSWHLGVDDLGENLNHFLMSIRDFMQLFFDMPWAFHYTRAQLVGIVHIHEHIISFV